MSGILFLVFLVLIGVGAFALRYVIRANRRRKLSKSSFSSQQSEWVRSNWALWDELPVEVRRKIESLALVFLDEKVFEACGEVEVVTEEMKVVVAAQACLLWINQRGFSYPALTAILMYPDAYRVKDEFGMESIRLGESWSRGTVVLAWKSVQSGGKNDEDGHNLVLHEFAHQLDTVNGPADGFPELPPHLSAQDWSRVFSEEFTNLCEDIERGRQTVMDGYGATNEAEFFSVATETFFEKPKSMKKDHPELYQILAKFYATDPLLWSLETGK